MPSSPRAFFDLSIPVASADSLGGEEFARVRDVFATLRRVGYACGALDYAARLPLRPKDACRLPLGALRASLPAARILVCSILTFFDSQDPYLPASVAVYNAAIPALAAQHGAMFVDLNAQTQLCRGPGDPLAYAMCAVCNGPCGGYNPASCPAQGGYAFCHPTAAGYSLVGGAWAAALLPVLHELAAARM